MHIWPGPHKESTELPSHLSERVKSFQKFSEKWKPTQLRQRKWLQLAQRSKHLRYCVDWLTIYCSFCRFWGCFSSFIAVDFCFRAFEDDAVFCLLKLSSSLRIRTARPSSYHEAKQAAVEYHGAKQTLFKAFQKAGLGAWVKKPIEQDQFSVTTWVSVATVIASNFSLSCWKNNFPSECVRVCVWGGEGGCQESWMKHSFFNLQPHACPLQQARDSESIELVMQLYIWV